MSKHLGDRISSLLDGELTGSERTAAQQHLDRCASCRTEMVQAEEGRLALRGLPMLDPPAGLTGRVAARRLRWGWAASFAAASLLAAGIALGPGEPGSPFDMGTLDDQHTARIVGDPGVSTIRGSGDAP